MGRALCLDHKCGNWRYLGVIGSVVLRVYSAGLHSDTGICGNTQRRLHRNPPAYGIFFDTNLAKNFEVWDRLKLQLRLEAFNVLNHPLFQNGFNSALNSQFGQIGSATGSGQSNQPRQVQIAAKLTW